MNNREKRLEAIRNLLKNIAVSNQEDLVHLLIEKGFPITQATLSRDMRQLKVVKVPDGKGEYVYRLPDDIPVALPENENKQYHPNIEFSGNLVVIKTRPGYAMGIASDIDTNGSKEIAGTIAGDDTILVIPREGYTRDQIAKALLRFMQ